MDLKRWQTQAEWIALEPETVVINGFDYGTVRKILWTGAMGDNNAGWQAFVLRVLGFLADLCPNNGTHAKHLSDKVFRKVSVVVCIL